MKRRASVAAATVMAASLLAGAGAPAAWSAPPVRPPHTSTSRGVVGPAPFSVSNLVDASSRREIAGMLRNTGASDAQIAAFLAQVQTFNGAAPTRSLVPGGYLPLSTAAPRYDLGGISDAVTSKNVRLTNCRITSYTLARGFTRVAAVGKPDTSQLFLDLENIDAKPALFGAADRAKFGALFGRVPTTKDKNSTRHLADVQQYLRTHGISFAFGRMSLVTVFVHDTLEPQGAMFVGHTGVLLTVSQRLLFIEKLAFDQPYQAVWFANRQQLSDYLMKQYDDGPDVEYGRPLVLENDRLIQGYRTLR